MTPLLQQLVQSLRCMPGIGPKSAQRIAFHLLRNRDDARLLANSLHEAMDRIAYCAACRTFSETDLCVFCASDRRDKSIMCIVESPADQYAIEQISYRGMYFVLHGRLSPLDGIGPDEIGITYLRERLNTERELREIIIATNPTLEGEATAYYIAQLAKQFSVACTRIAHGVPLGGALESIDTGTLTHAFAGREIISD